MSFRRLVLSILFIAIFTMAVRVSLDSDSWWHLRTGQLIAETGQIPKTDSFSYTQAGETWRYPSAAWLSQLGLFTTYSAFGPGGVNLLVAALVTCAFVFIYRAMSGGIFLRAFALILAATASGVYWAARPYLASFVLAAIFLWILEDYRWGRGDRRLWLPLLMIAWANLHPGFAIGFMLVGVYALAAGCAWLGDHWGAHMRPDVVALRKALPANLGRWVLVLVLMSLAVSINPSGPVLLRYPFETVSIGALQDLIQEWQSPNFHALPVQPFAWLLFLVVGAVGAAGRRLALTDFLLVTLFAILSLLAARNIAIFALVAPIVLTRYAEPIFEVLRQRWRLQPLGTGQQSGTLRMVNLVLLAGMLLPAVARISEVLPAAASEQHFEQNLPLGAVAYLQENRPEGRLFNSYNWGGYLIWSLPDYPVFVDGRTDLHGDELILEWLAIVQAEPGWEQDLRTWDVNLVLIEPQWALARVLPYAGWTMLYEDEHSVLYGRP